MQGDNLNQVTALMEHRLKNHSLVKSLPRIQTILQSMIVEAQLDATNQLAGFNYRRMQARGSVVSFINDCYGGYQHVITAIIYDFIVSSSFVFATHCE